jgi:hypothetical protein
MNGLPLPILRVAPSVRVAEAKIAAVRSRLAPLLESLCFPVHRWQLIIAAHDYGSDHVTRRVLQSLRAESYADAESLVDELVQTLPI